MVGIGQTFQKLKGILSQGKLFQGKDYDWWKVKLALYLSESRRKSLLSSIFEKRIGKMKEYLDAFREILIKRTDIVATPENDPKKFQIN